MLYSRFHCNWNCFYHSRNSFYLCQKISTPLNIIWWWSYNMNIITCYLWLYHCWYLGPRIWLQLNPLRWPYVEVEYTAGLPKQVVQPYKMSLNTKYGFHNSFFFKYFVQMNNENLGFDSNTYRPNITHARNMQHSRTVPEEVNKVTRMSNEDERKQITQNG